MTYTFHLDTDPLLMDDFVENHEQNSLYQCSKWAEVKNNWDHFFTSCSEGDKIVATALVLKRKMPFGKCLFYIPRGPVMDYHNPELVSFFLDHLVSLAKQHHAIALRFDPNVFSRKYPYKEKDQDHPLENEDVIALLKQHHAQHSGYTINIEETTQPRFNASMTPQDYMKRIDKKVRQSIATSEKKGAQFYEGHQYIHEFAQVMKYTEQRKGVALRNEEYFKRMADVYGEQCIIMVAKLNFPRQIAYLNETIQKAQHDLEATPYEKQKKQFQKTIDNAFNELSKLKEEYEKEGKDEIILSGKLAIFNKNRMEFVYAGNNAEYLRMRTIYALYGKYFDIAEEKNIPYVSMGGIDGTLDDGLTKFKSSWCMDVEEYIGEFNIVLDQVVYTLFDKVYPWVLKQSTRLRTGKEKVTVRQ